MVCRGEVGVVACALAIAAAIPGISAAADGASARVGDRLSTTVSIGFDSFSEKYSIEEADTLDHTNELRTAAGVTYRYGWKGGSNLEVRDVVTLSDVALRNRWNVDLDLRSRRDDRFALSSELTSKRFDGGDDASLSTDYLQEAARLLYRLRLSDVLVVDLRDRFEVVDFDEESAYEYDYRRNRASAGLAIQPGLDTSLDFTYALAQRDVPDSSAIDYVEQGFRAEWWQAFGLRTDLEVNGEFERRRYREDEVRPGYFSLSADGHLAVRLAGRCSLRFRQELEAVSYDIPDSLVYYNSVLYRTGAGGAVDVTPGLELGLEPRFTTLRADEGSDEDYDEVSAVLEADWMRVDRLWITASFEAGKRDYGAAAADGIFSDYTFLRTNLFATVELGRRTAWSLYLSHEPERHDNQNDDTTTTLVSTDVTVRF